MTEKRAELIWSTSNCYITEEGDGQFFVDLPALGEFGLIAARPGTFDGGVALLLYQTWPKESGEEKK